MKVNLYYFSGTGNSLFIAKTIQEGIVKEHDLEKGVLEDVGPMVSILPIQKFGNLESIVDESDIVGIIYPTYFLDTPSVVKNFAKRLKIKKDCYLFFYANYGETLGNALHNMNQLFEPGQVGGNYEVALPDNSIIFETKKEKIPGMLESGEATIQAHAIDIYHRTITQQSHYHLGYHLVSNVMKPVAKHGLGFYKMKVNPKSCNGCGLCEKVCPMKNIHLEENQNLLKTPVFDKNCESCFSCLHNCPKEAITYPGMSKKKRDYQYRHPKVRVNELMNN